MYLVEAKINVRVCRLWKGTLSLIDLQEHKLRGLYAGVQVYNVWYEHSVYMLLIYIISHVILLLDKCTAIWGEPN